jgi:hypothetical protein
MRALYWMMLAVPISIACFGPGKAIDAVLGTGADTGTDIGKDCSDYGGVMSVWYADADGDMYGDPDVSVTACNQPDGYLPNSDDCDDGNEHIHPLAIETDCTDPIDYNCDGSVFYEDADEDGYAACEDCDDSSADVTSPSTWYIDYDNDGYGSAAYTQLSCGQPLGWADNAEDCDDLNSNVNPLAAEECDGVDNNCDGSVDEGC